MIGKAFQIHRKEESILKKVSVPALIVWEGGNKQPKIIVKKKVNK